LGAFDFQNTSVFGFPESEHFGDVSAVKPRPALFCAEKARKTASIMHLPQKRPQIWRHARGYKEY
jgi:hypothetical protein